MAGLCAARVRLFLPSGTAWHLTCLCKNCLDTTVLTPDGLWAPALEVNVEIGAKRSRDPEWRVRGSWYKCGGSGASGGQKAPTVAIPVW